MVYMSSHINDYMKDMLRESRVKKIKSLDMIVKIDAKS